MCQQSCVAPTTQGLSFADLTAFSGDDCCPLVDFFCLGRSSGEAVPVSFLCPLVYCLSSHNIRDGIPIYYMAPFENLRSIFQNGALLSNEILRERGIITRSIANNEVQALRSRIFVWDSSSKIYRSLHSYVPFYFATHTPMLRNNQEIQNKLVIFEVSRYILRNQGVLFTDGNASNQQLSKSKGERVGITPATDLNNPCMRIYRPGGPFGSNPDRSDFYSNTVFLSHLRWDIINDHESTAAVKIRIRHAEVLVPDSLPTKEIQGISVCTLAMVQAVNSLIDQCGLKGRIPTAVYKPNLFIQ